MSENSKFKITAVRDVATIFKVQSRNACYVNKSQDLFNDSEAVWAYRQVSNIRRTLVGNKIVDHSDVVGATPVGAAPNTSSFST